MIDYEEDGGISQFDQWISICGCFFLVFGAVTATSGGSLLDFSGLARMIFCGLAVACVIAAAFTWKATDSRGKKIKVAVTGVSLVVIIAGGFLDAMFEKVIPGTIEYVSLQVPFEESEIESLEAYHYDGVPVAAEKKLVTGAEDITYLYETFRDLLLQEKEVEELTGASVTSFRFHLTDGTAYEIIYVGHGVKSGKIKTSGGSSYFTSADIGQIWKNLSYEAEPVSETELPAVTTKQ